MMTKRMKMLFAAALAVCVLGGGVFAQTTPPAGSPVAKHGKLSVSGNRIVNKDGQPVALRGMSFFWSTTSWEGSKFYTAGVTDWLVSDWKVDIVRVAVDPGSRGNWDTVVKAAIAKGIYVIIDWHSHTANNDEQAAKTFFAEQAAAYKNTPNVLFEIFNEPIEQSWSTIKTYATAVVSSIRGAGADNIIIVGSRDYSKRVDEAAASPLSGTNIAYSVHYYTAEPGTQHQSDLRTFCNTALNKGLALFVTEFGISEANGNGKTDTKEADVWFEFLDRNSMGWANWSIVDKGESSCALNSGASTSGGWNSGNLTASGTYIRGKLLEYGTKTWTVNVTKTGQGTVAISPTGGPSYQHGTMITLTATGDPGWAFEKWEGADGASLGIRNPATFAGPLYSNKSVVAVFGQGSMIRNGTFTNAIGEWTQQSTGVTLAQDDGTLKVTVTGASAAVRQFDLNLEKGKKYALSFRAKSSGGNVSVTPRMTNRTGAVAYWEGAPVALTSAWAATQREFSMCAETDAAARFWLQTNDASGAVYNVDDIMLDASGTATGCQGTAVLPSRVSTHKAVWSVSRSGGALQLRGPAESGARVSLYDVRGKVVMSLAAADGLSLGAGIPAGSYFVVVRDRAGGEVLRTRVVLAR